MKHCGDSYSNDLQPDSKVKPFELFNKKIFALFWAFFLSPKNLLLNWQGYLEACLFPSF